MVTIEILLPAIVTLMVLTFLYKENPIYRIAEYLAVSSASSALLVTAWRNIDKWGTQKLAAGEYVYLIGLILGLLLYTRFWKKYSWLSRFGISFLVTMGFGVAITGTIKAEIISQVVATAQLPIVGVPIGTSLSNLVLITIFLTSVFYFVYSIWGIRKNSTSTASPLENILITYGRYGLMLAFGTILGNMVMDRFTSVIDTMRTLLNLFGLALV